MCGLDKWWQDYSWFHHGFGPFTASYKNLLACEWTGTQWTGVSKAQELWSTIRWASHKLGVKRGRMVGVCVCFGVSLRDYGHFCLDFCGVFTALKVWIQCFKCCNRAQSGENNLISLSESAAESLTDIQFDASHQKQDFVFGVDLSGEKMHLSGHFVQKPSRTNKIHSVFTTWLKYCLLNIVFTHI